MADPKKTKLIDFDHNGDMTVLVEGKPVPVTIRVGQVERIQALMDCRREEAEASPKPDGQGPAEKGRYQGLPGMVQWNYDVLEVILNDNIEKPRFSREELPEKVPVHHATMIVNEWMTRMLYNPGEKKEPSAR